MVARALSPLWLLVTASCVAASASPRHSRTRSSSPSLTPLLSPSRAPLPQSGVAALLAGGGRARACGYAQGAGATLFSGPSAVAAAGGSTFVVDAGNNAVRQLGGAGAGRTFAGGGVSGTASGCAIGWGTNALFSFSLAAGGASLAVGAGMAPSGGGPALFLSDPGCAAVRILLPSVGTVYTGALAGGAGPGAADGVGSAARFSALGLAGLAAAPASGALFVADRNNHLVRAIVVASGLVTRLAGGGAAGGTAAGRLDGTGSNALFSAPAGLARQRRQLATERQRRRRCRDGASSGKTKTRQVE
jgi:hypothetical protein